VVFVLGPALGAFASAWLSRGGLARIIPFTTEWQPLLVTVAGCLTGFVLLFYSVKHFLRWQATRYVLTTRRIIVRTGWLRRSDQQFPLFNIRDIGVRQSLLQRLLRSGNILLDAGPDHRAAIVDVPGVEKFRNLALDAIEELRSRPVNGDHGMNSFPANQQWRQRGEGR
jgi:membrane protein YdbS with pleckstrin-like domain